MNNEVIDLTKIDLPSNEPRYYKEYEIYAKILQKKVNDQSITNIGIVAPYGSGKSSLIKTFIDLQTKEDRDFNDKVISVSLANYGSIMKNVEHFGEDFLENEQNIEKSILQQLFYKNDNKKTPYSRFKTLKDNRKQNIGKTIVLLSSIICLAFVGFQFFDNIFKISLDTWWRRLILIIALLLMIVCFGFLFFFIINNRYIKSIQVGEINFEKNENETLSVFNQYLDEIIYFFQKNEFNILIIEDLDRFNNLEIFSKLKELNTLLNKNDKVIAKHRKITFIYAVKDSMFKSEEERSKFFEFILPVIPSLTSKNVKDELTTMLEEKIGYMPLSSNIVIDISDYISSRRILNNVINDFIIHLSLLKLTDVESRNKLFCLMVLKNILPLEYEKLQKQDTESIIFNLLNNEKNNFIEKQLLKFKKDIEKLNDDIEKINDDHTTSFNELELLFRGVICKHLSNYYDIDYQIKTFIGVQTVEVRYNYVYSYSSSITIDIGEISEKYLNDRDFFSKKEKILFEKLQNKKEEIQSIISSIKNKIYQITNMSFFELYSQFPEEFEKVDFKEHFIKLVLVNGYVDETHMDYLSEQTDTFMSSRDKEIIKKINRKDQINIFDKIDSPNKVILSLNESKFGHINIFNYYLIDELISNKNEYSLKFTTFINMLNNKQYDIREKIEDIVNSNFNYEKIIVALCKKVSFIWDIIFESKTISNVQKEKLLLAIINNKDMNITILKSLNSNGNVSKQINSIDNFTQRFISKNIKIDELHIKIGFSLEKVGKIYYNNASKYIVENNLYDFNYNNLTNILVYFYGKNKNDVTMQNYDIICELPVCPLKDRIQRKFNEYLKVIYNNTSDGRLSSANLTNLLVNEKIDIEVKKSIVQKEKNIISYSPKLDDLIVEELLQKDQIILKVEDLLKLYENINKNLIVKYFNSKYYTIELNKEILDSNEAFKEYFFDNVDISLYSDKLGNGYKNISKFKNKQNIEFLLDNNLVLFCKNDFIDFLETGVYIEKYCLLFDEIIFDKLERKEIVLNSSSLIKLYFISKRLKIKLLDYVLGTIDDNVLDEILKEESALEFINAINNIDSLTDQCKIKLIHNIDNQEIVEKLFISLRVDDDIWIRNFKLKNNCADNQGTIKYKYCSNEFYDLLKSKTKCKRRNGYAYLSFD